MWRIRFGFAGSALLLLACEVQRQPSVDSTSVAVADSLPYAELIDAPIAPAIAGQEGWNYVESGPWV